jgi:acetylornithine/succinyldiaminopimelate/putrescine aminotransferase
LEVLLDGKFIESVKRKEALMVELIQHPAIVEKRSSGLWMAIEFDSFATNHAIIKKCIEKGLISDWFLFNDKSMRIAPPLIITELELTEMCRLVVETVKEVMRYEL